MKYKLDGTVKKTSLRPKQLTPANLEIIDSFKRQKSLAKTGETFGITRERVRQVINKALEMTNDPELKEAFFLVRHGADLSGRYCKGCSRALGAVRRANRLYCGVCQSLNTGATKRPITFLPKYCKCGTEFATTRANATWANPRQGGICRRCYTKSPQYKALQRRNYLKNIERIRLSQREYHVLNRDHLLESHRQWKIKKNLEQ